ncbi:unnamed protein product [Kluyveromyces dobzhanskii CBS 2104]|uniref:WGS project CCBQ000000000 data, contig 00012 n=1 Tax=Kluyveromyces dobzhanskii CBS 2104 TaxID=1427455 RepID=A0A0A8L2T8_9SACH|nr:unnamed protein product [Kluyveromyces dobzhanskii CBS 2104]
MSDLSDEMELPVTKDLNRELVSSFVQKNGSLDIDKLLLENNFQYVSLDELSYEVTALKQSMEQTILDEISDNYPEYMEICERFDTSNNNEVLDKLKQVLNDLQQFNKQLTQLCDSTVAETREKTVTVLSYFKSLDSLLGKLDDITRLADSLKICQELFSSLQSMTQLQIDDELTFTVAKQLSTILIRCDYRFRHLEDNESTLVTRMRNDFKSILESSKALVKPILEKQSPQQTAEIS